MSNLLSGSRGGPRSASDTHRLEEDAPWVTQQRELRHVVSEREEAVGPEERVAREGGEHRERTLR